MLLFIIFVLLGFFLLAVQTTFFPLFPNWLGRPDLVFVLLVFVAYKFRWVLGIVTAFILGWMMDVASGMYLGTYPVTAILVFCVVKFFSQNSPVKETAFQIPLVGLSYFIVQCIFYLFFLLTQPGVLPPWSWERIVQETFILLVAAIPCFVFYNWMYEKLLAKQLFPRAMKRRHSGNTFR